MDKNTLAHTTWECKYHMLTLKEYIDPFTGESVSKGKK